jgi:hypothetical protein
MEVVQLNVARSCIIEEDVLICLQEASPVSSLVCRGMIR